MAQPRNGSLWYLSPWSLVLGSVVAAFMAVLLSLFPGDISTPIRVALIVMALCGTGVALSWRFRRGLSEFFDERLEPAALVGAAAGIALLAAMATDVGDPQIPMLQRNAQGVQEYNPAYNPGWDSIRLLFNVMTAVALGGAALVLMPWSWRKRAFMLIVFFHFGGVCTASASAPTSQGSYPWVPSQLWNHVYRPYLCFMYLNNAYHFYSPEPGPSTMLWFRVEFDDGSARWVRMVDREDCPTRLEYQRMLALTEQVNQTDPNMPRAEMMDYLRTSKEFAGHTGLYEKDENGNDIKSKPRVMPRYPGLDRSFQYRELTSGSRRFVQSYVRHVARTTKHETKPEAKVKYIKCYRVTHNIIQPGDLAQRADPCDPIFYWVWFNGEFEPDGNYRDHTKLHEGWHDLPQDLYLNWMIPIFRKPKDPNDPTGEQELVNCLKWHAGDSPILAWDTWPNQFYREPREKKTQPGNDTTPVRHRPGDSGEPGPRPGNNASTDK